MRAGNPFLSLSGQWKSSLAPKSQKAFFFFSILYIRTNNKYSIRLYQGGSNSNAEAVMRVCSFATGFIHDAQDGIKPRCLLPKSGNSVGARHWLTIAMAPLCSEGLGAWSGTRSFGEWGCGLQPGGSAVVGGKKEMQLRSHPSRGRRSMFGQWLCRKKMCRFNFDQP